MAYFFFQSDPILEKYQIGEKPGFCQAVVKYENENQANFPTRTSAKSSSVLKKIRKRKKKQRKNNKKI